jgi:hypothetical protein
MEQKAGHGAGMDWLCTEDEWCKDSLKGYTRQSSGRNDGENMMWYIVIPWFTSLIHSSKTVCKTKTRKTKMNFPKLPDGNNNWFAKERRAHTSKNWLVNWKTSINLCILYKRKLVNRLLIYRGITVFCWPQIYHASDHKSDFMSREHSS